MYLIRLLAAALAMFLGAVTAAQAVSAGKVVYAHGDAKLLDTGGQSRAITRGAEVAAGETLVTEEGRMQVQFADGGFISVQPNTQFKIDEYQYAGTEDGSERSFFNLVKGGIRFVTGAIGHQNRQNYRIKTTVATIGIRGSAGNLLMCVGSSCPGRPPGLYATGNDDTLVMINDTGETPILTGVTYHSACNTCKPNKVGLGLSGFTSLEGDEEQEQSSDDEQGTSPEFTSGEQRNADGKLSSAPISPPAKPTGGGPFALAFASDLLTTTRTSIDARTDAFPPTQIDDQFAGQPHSVRLLTAQNADFIMLGDGELFLTRWTNGTFSDSASGTAELTNNQSVHLVYGPPSQATPLGTSVIATYTFAAGTHSTSPGGVVGAGVTSGALTVDFSNVHVDLDMNVSHAGVDYVVNGGGPLNIVPGPDRNYPLFDLDASTTSGFGASVHGFLAGQTTSPAGQQVPSYAGLAYQINALTAAGAPNPINGAAGFQYSP